MEAAACWAGWDLRDFSRLWDISAIPGISKAPALLLVQEGPPGLAFLRSLLLLVQRTFTNCIMLKWRFF